MDCSPPGSSVHGILQARTLERVVIPSSRDQTCVSRVSCTSRQVLYHGHHLHIHRQNVTSWLTDHPNLKSFLRFKQGSHLKGIIINSLEEIFQMPLLTNPYIV